MSHVIDECPECGGVFIERTREMTTLVGYSSPDGHDHDGNCLGRNYYCAEGHCTGISLRRTCPACDWKGRESCFCHSGPKVDRWPAGDIPDKGRLY